ncbi:hypothetical protein N8269_02035 [Candidatus Thioglobus sp.]|nr:hypothetical protein [Candidatus Thioglobus sp.]
MKNCPYCDEEIQDEAIKCQHCDSFLNETKEISNSETQSLTGIKAMLGVLFLLQLLTMYFVFFA